MTQLVCPLCGRHVSLKYFDPSDFDADILGVEMTGLGRGRGFAVTDRFSLLGDSQVTSMIKDRCYEIIRVIEGVEPVSGIQAQKFIKSNAEWAAWGKSAQAEMTEKDQEISRLNAKVTELRGKVEALEECDVDDDSAAAAENERLLRWINKSCNTHYSDLGDAVDYLLEGV
jgi:outer membrane murein-binding lipoprotein Lpp